MASLLLRPGARVRLKGQDDHVPDFYVVRCDHDRCWIRQPNWNPEATMDVRFTQLFVPGPTSSVSMVSGGVALPPLASAGLAAVAMAPPSADQPPWPDNVIDMAAYRRRKAR
ncbi:MAG: hypothetical protein ACHWZW_19500 [Spirulina sp.]